jgi:ligand-binding sensor domain-containing protein
MDGILWIGTLNEGLNRIDITQNKITRFKNIPTDSQTISSNTITGIIEDEQRMLWITTNNGLNIFNKSTGIFTQHHSAADNPKGLRTKGLNGIVKGKEAIIWISGLELHKQPLLQPFYTL